MMERTNIINSIVRDREFLPYKSEDALKKIVEANADMKIQSTAEWKEAIQTFKMIAYMERATSNVDWIIESVMLDHRTNHKEDELIINVEDVLNKLLDDHLILFKEVIRSHKLIFATLRHYVWESLETFRSVEKAETGVNPFKIVS